MKERLRSPVIINIENSIKKKKFIFDLEQVNIYW